MANIAMRKLKSLSKYIATNNPKKALMPMTQLYKLNHVPSMTDKDILRALHAVIDVIVQVERKDGKRRIASVYFKKAS